jgi:hypothetical protein
MHGLIKNETKGDSENGKPDKNLFSGVDLKGGGSIFALYGNGSDLNNTLTIGVRAYLLFADSKSKPLKKSLKKINKPEYYTYKLITISSLQ